MRILVVEDEKRIQDFLSRGLESAGYAVDVAGNGATAVDLVHGAEYDLIILDLMLPDMDGLTVLQKIPACPNPERPRHSGRQGERSGARR